MCNFEKLRILRVIKRNTQTDIAKMLGCSVAAYSKKERGIYEFSTKEKLSLKAYYEMTWGDFLEIFHGYKLDEGVKLDERSEITWGELIEIFLTSKSTQTENGGLANAAGY